MDKCCDQLGKGPFVTWYDQAAGLVLRQHVSEVVGGVEDFGVRVWYFGLEPLLSR